MDDITLNIMDGVKAVSYNGLQCLGDQHVHLMTSAPCCTVSIKIALSPGNGFNGGVDGANYSQLCSVDPLADQHHGMEKHQQECKTESSKDRFEDAIPNLDNEISSTAVSQVINLLQYLQKSSLSAIKQSSYPPVKNDYDKCPSDVDVKKKRINKMILDMFAYDPSELVIPRTQKVDSNYKPIFEECTCPYHLEKAGKS